MVRVTRIELRDFRNYEAATFEPSAGLTVVAGPNGAGKTNLLEALYFGCTARSCRTSNERELVRRGASVTRVALDTATSEGEHRIEVGFEPGEPKRLRVDDNPVESLTLTAARPLVSVFLPERLELVKGAPSGRRAHLDRLVAALWPARAETRAAYSRALAQRNALLLRVRSGTSDPGALDAWDVELARQGIRLMADRDEAVSGLAGTLQPSRGRPRPAGRGRAPLPAPVESDRRRWARGGARRAPRRRPRARLQRPRPAPRRAPAAARRTLRCGRTARRASSARPCSRSCSPSARSWASVARESR